MKTLKFISDSVVQFTPAQPAQDFAEIVEWEERIKTFMIKYYSNKSVYIITYDEPWSFGKTIQPTKRIYCNSADQNCVFLSSHVSHIDDTIASSIISSIDFSINLLWLTTTDPTSYICKISNNANSIDDLIKNFKMYNEKMDFLIPSEDGNKIIIINPICNTEDLFI